MTTPDSKLPNNIRRWRRALGMTQQELAKMVGVSGQQVSSWERGENQPGTDDMIARIAAALGVEPEALGLPLDGSPLRRWRRALGMTQPELAKAIGVAPTTISFWERGISRPKWDSVIARIAAALGVDPKELGLRSYYGGTRKSRPKAGGGVQP